MTNYGFNYSFSGGALGRPYSSLAYYKLRPTTL